jgi:hypothetical protein
MPIDSTDIKIRLSGGAANSNVNLSLGGAKSSVEVVDDTLNNLFDLVTGAESEAGTEEYRAIYIHNGHATLTMQNTHVYISSDTDSPDDEWDIALHGGGLNTTLETVANEATAPIGEVFTHPVDYDDGLVMGNIPPGQHYGLWIRRTVDAGAGAIDDNSVTLKVDCDTAE